MENIISESTEKTSVKDINTPENNQSDSSENNGHIEFTKILTASIVFMYIINWAITWFVYAKTGNISADLKEYLDIPLNVVMAGYLTKSGIENVFTKKN